MAGQEKAVRRALALGFFLVAAGCDAILGINEFPAEDGGADSGAPSPDAPGPQDDGTVGTDGGTSDVFAETGDALADAGDALADAVGDTSVVDAASDSPFDAVASDATDASDGGPDPVVAISVGSTEACAVTKNGSLYCWGPGPIGDGTNAPRWQATRITGSFLATPTGQTVTDVCVGGLHACALVGPGPGGNLACWGNNDYGQLGIGHLADVGALVLSPALAPIQGPPVQCGAFHSCFGANAAFGGLRCWGSNSYGELGHTPGTSGDIAISGSVVSEANPNPLGVSGSVGPLALGNGFTCGVFNNQISCWGSNTSLQLNSLDAGAFSPFPVASLTGVSGIAAGAKHACALDSFGHVTCWGDNSSGQLGTNGPPIAADASSVAVSVRPSAADPASHIASGGNASCRSFYPSFIECWGANEHGQLGHDPATDSMKACPGNGGPCNSSPTAFAANLKVTTLAMGPTAACALTSDGTVWCWGSPPLLGNGPPDGSTIQFTPVQVQGLPPP